MTVRARGVSWQEEGDVSVASAAAAAKRRSMQAPAGDADRLSLAKAPDAGDI
jgi:hypothetical protein